MIYHVVESSSLTDLEKQINDFLKSGWMLQGGVSVLCYNGTDERKGFTDTHWEYYQAMIKTMQPEVNNGK